MEARSPLAAWETFFFLIGSSAAALTGLQFVVIALIAESRRRATTREIQAFSTPTIVHFAGVLLVCAILSAPWHSLSPVAVILGVCGGVGIAYTLVVIKRARSQSTYRVVGEDWLWHVVLPFISYVVLLVSAILFTAHVHRVLFAIGASVLLLLFVGLHNAWDTVTYIMVELAPPAEPERRANDSLASVTTVTDISQLENRPQTKPGPNARRHRGKK
jgi:hypothetical protein